MMAAAQPGGGDKAPTRYYDQLCGIKCHELNEDRLIRLERNDPDIDGLRIYGDYWSPRAGKAIGRSRYLRKLFISVGCPVKESRHTFIHELFQGLACNRSIEMLEVIIVDREQGTSLDTIDLLAPFLKHNSNLRSFDTGGLRHRMNSLSSSLENRTSNIEHLGLMDSLLKDDDVTILCEVLVKTNRLRSLNLNELRAPSVCTLLSTLSHPECQLEKLGLWACSCNDDDDAFLNVGQTFAVNNSLLHLDLSWSSLSTQAWIALFILVRETFVGLEVLRLVECILLDEEISELIATLANNKRLRQVQVWMCCGKTIWNYCSRILCNKTCIDSTFSSNHTLHEFDIDTYDPSEYDDEDDDSVVDDALKDDVMWLLKMNENENKAQVSQMKIIQAHFLDQT